MADKVNPVIWFEIPVNDLQRAKAFYQNVFGFEFRLDEMGPWKMAFFPMEDGVVGTGGALVQAEGYTPALTGTVVYFTVADIEATLERVKASGGEVLTPKMSIGEYGFIGHFRDTEGNRVAVHSM